MQFTHVLMLDGCCEDGDGPAVGWLDQLDTVQVRVVDLHVATHDRRPLPGNREFSQAAVKPEARGPLTWHSGSPSTMNSILTEALSFVLRLEHPARNVGLNPNDVIASRGWTQPR